jgi:hypothetical protein
MATSLKAWCADVDRFFGVTLVVAREVAYRDAGRERIAGRWLGCYAQPVAAFGPMWMDLDLDVDTNTSQEALHVISADGNDGLGRFTLAGTLDTARGGVHLVKQYVGSHAVAYDGFFDGEAIRGVWSIGPLRGLFALWNAEILAPADVERGRRPRRSFAPFLVQLAAFVTAPLRAVTLVRHANLVSKLGRVEKLLPPPP